MREKGLTGEQVAREYLVSNGYKVIESNVYSRYGEIDIIAKDPEGVLVFFEVKAYQKNALVDSLSAITPAKQRKLRRTAEIYIHRKRLYDVDARFDVICIETGQVSDHVVDAF